MIRTTLMIMFAFVAIWTGAASASQTIHPRDLCINIEGVQRERDLAALGVYQEIYTLPDGTVVETRLCYSLEG